MHSSQYASLPPAGRMSLTIWGSPGVPRDSNNGQRQNCMEILPSCSSSLHRPFPASRFKDAMIGQQTLSPENELMSKPTCYFRRTRCYFHGTQSIRNKNEIQLPYFIVSSDQLGIMLQVFITQEKTNSTLVVLTTTTKSTTHINEMQVRWDQGQNRAGSQTHHKTTAKTT